MVNVLIYFFIFTYLLINSHLGFDNLPGRHFPGFAVRIRGFKSASSPFTWCFRFSLEDAEEPNWSPMSASVTR